MPVEEFRACGDGFASPSLSPWNGILLNFLPHVEKSSDARPWNHSDLTDPGVRRAVQTLPRTGTPLGEGAMRNTNDIRRSLVHPLPGTRADEHHTSWNMRHLLESNGVPVTAVEYARQRTIFRQGDCSDNVIHIERGEVFLAVSTHSGQEAICGVLGVGAFLGEETLIGESVRRQSAVALIATQVLLIGKAHMVRLLHSQPAFADRFIEHLVTRNRRLEVDLTDQLLYSAEHRLAHTLLVLAGCDASRPCRGALPHVSQETIAEMVGTTRSRVNAFMGKFKRAGFIEEVGGTLYVSTSRLPSVCDEYQPLPIVAPAIMSPTRSSDDRRWRRAG